MKYFLKIIKIFNKKFLIKITGGFWANYKIKSGQSYIIDLSVEEISHFGDNLFFISAFYGKDCKNFTFLVSKKYYFLWKKFGISNVFTSLDSCDSKCIYVSSFETKIINKKIAQKFKEKILFDFTDSNINSPLHKHINDFFKLKKISNDHPNIQLLDEALNIEHINKIGKEKFFIYNDIMYSRGFLRRKLSLKLKKYIDSKIGYNNPICFIGSEDDKRFTNYNSNLTDLRGEVNFDQMVSLILNDNCLGFIGLDNGLMHLSLFLNKKVNVIFRGKISKSQSDHHYRCINISMNEEAKNNIEYINIK
tara:strand:+ start:337 stop:1254 length:918 start_codon:yes stop_codon:yes gene_type:complete